MSWSTSSIAVPRVDDLRAAAGRARSLSWCRDRLPARRGTPPRLARRARGPRRPACAGPASARRRPIGELGESLVRQRLVDRRHPAAAAFISSRSGLPRSVRKTPARFSRDRQVVEQLDAAAMCGRDRAGPPVRSAPKTAYRAKATRGRGEPGAASMNVVLPAPLGPISPRRGPRRPPDRSRRAHGGRRR